MRKNQRMKKGEKFNLENYRGVFKLIGLCVALGAITLAFEWRTYEHSLYNEWVLLDDYMDSLELPPLIPPEKPQVIPMNTPVNNFKKNVSTRLDLTHFLDDKWDEQKQDGNEGDVSEAPGESDLFGDEPDEILEPWTYLPPIYNPASKPYFLSKRCAREKDNHAKYLCSMNSIRNRIKNELVIPFSLGSDVRFAVQFQIDTTGKINHIKVEGTNNIDLINSTKRILSSLPKMVPPKHLGKKRIMTTGFPVIIRLE